MSRLVSTSVILALAFAIAPALAQQPKPSAPVAQPPQPAPPGPYKVVTVTLPKPLGDPSLDAFRKDIADIASRKDRKALAGKVVAKGFFWQREDSDGADPKKSGIDNLAAALNLDAKDGSGWQALAAYAADPTAAPVPEMKGTVCSPATAELDDQQFEQLGQATKTDPSDWSYPSAAGVEMHAKADGKSPVVEKLGLYLVRVLTDQGAAQGDSGGDWIHVVAPSGKTGYVSADSLAPLSSDQLCYLKDATGWHISGFVGGGGGGDQ